MTTVEMVKLISEKKSLKKADVAAVLEGVVETMTEELKAGRDVSLNGVGIFKCAVQKARTCRNPKTGEPVEVPEKKTVKFKIAKSLKESALK